MNKRGFTLIELLVVIAIIGLLSTLAVVALGSARLKSRDAKRLSDLRQISIALELYYADNNAYPVNAAPGLVLGVAANNSVCLGTAGWGAANCAGAYMSQVPASPAPGSYTYTSAGTTYIIDAALEGTVNNMTGAIQGTPSGIIDAAN